MKNGCKKGIMGLKDLKHQSIRWGAGIFLLIMGCFLPNYVSAQYGVYTLEDIGFGLWFNVENLSVDPATQATTSKDRAYIDVLPSSLISVGFGGGYSFGEFGLSIGYLRGGAIVGQDADVQQNGDPSDDLEVKTATRVSQSWSIQSNLFYPLYGGIGADQGTFEFSVLTPGGGNQVKRVAFYNPFLIFGLVIDTAIPTFTLLSNVYVKVPTESYSFSGTILGVAVTGVFN